MVSSVVARWDVCPAWRKASLGRFPPACWTGRAPVVPAYPMMPLWGLSCLHSWCWGVLCVGGGVYVLKGRTVAVGGAFLVLGASVCTFKLLCVVGVTAITTVWRRSLRGVSSGSRCWLRQYSMWSREIFVGALRREEKFYLEGERFRQDSGCIAEVFTPCAPFGGFLAGSIATREGIEYLSA